MKLSKNGMIPVNLILDINTIIYRASARNAFQSKNATIRLLKVKDREKGRENLAEIHINLADYMN